MKKITLVAVFALHAAQTATALAPFEPQNHPRFSFENPIAFQEKGIAFYIFPDGTFDFNTQPSTSGGIYYRQKPGGTYGTPAVINDGGIRIEHDGSGNVRRVGNVFMNYDYANRIKRIGSVYLAYHRNRLVQIGGMRILYDRRGAITGTLGSIKSRGAYADVNNNYWNNNPAPAPLNGDFYYYRIDGTKARID